MKYRYQLLLYFLFLGNLASAQKSMHLCNTDTTSNRAFLEHLISVKPETADFGSTLNNFVLKYYQDDCYCNIVNFAKLFDYMLLNGLDLHFDVEKAVRVSVDLRNYDFTDNAQDTENAAKLADMNQRMRLYISYLNVKDRYEKMIASQYGAAGSGKLENDVNTIVNSGIYNYPKSVSDILTLKYAGITREKFDRALEDAYQAYVKSRN